MKQRTIEVPVRLDLTDLHEKLRAVADTFDEAANRIREYLDRTPEEWQSIADEIVAKSTHSDEGVAS